MSALLKHKNQPKTCSHKYSQAQDLPGSRKLLEIQDSQTNQEAHVVQEVRKAPCDP